MSDAIRELGSLLDEAGLGVTFSAHCASGLVGREICQCWRCRGVEPEEEHPKWARAAELISRGHSAEVASWLRLQEFRRDCPVCENAGRKPRCPGCGRDGDGRLPRADSIKPLALTPESASSFTTGKPTEPGWYWCRNSCDESPAGAEFVCRIYRGPGGLECSWMTHPGVAQVMHESEWSSAAEWCGPLSPPARSEPT